MALELLEFELLDPQALTTSASSAAVQTANAVRESLCMLSILLRIRAPPQSRRCIASSATGSRLRGRDSEFMGVITHSLGEQFFSHARWPDQTRQV